MAVLKQSTAYTRTFMMIDSSNHVSGKTGLSPVVSISKAGAAFATAAGSVSELANGWYKISLTTVDTATLGDLSYHCTDTGADPTDFLDEVRANILGDTLPANVTQFAGTTATTSAGRPEVNTTHIAGSTVNTAAAQLGVNVVNWKNSVAATVDSSGYPVVTIKNGTGAGEIATSAGAVLTVSTLTNAPSDTAGTTTLLSRLTSLRAGYLDNLSAGVLTQANIRTAIGLASANLDTQLDALPTAAENASTLLVAQMPTTQHSGEVGFTLSNIDSNSSFAATFIQYIEGLSIAYSTVGAAPGTPASTSSHVVLDLAYNDDEINNYLIVFRNNFVSPRRLYTRFISDWTLSTKTAILDSALPWTPTDFADEYWIFPFPGYMPGSVGSVSAVSTGAIQATSFAAGAIDSAAIAANAIGASEIADGAIDAGALAADAVDKIIDDPIGDGSITLRQAIRVIMAALAGKLSGAATTSITIRNTADSQNVIVATVDSNGNRSSVTLNP